jgi:hypothetical protein
MSTKPENSLWPYFHKGGMQNSSQHRAHCKGCVARATAEIEGQGENNGANDGGGGTVLSEFTAERTLVRERGK